jgi:hypothetical protein
MSSIDGWVPAEIDIALRAPPRLNYVRVGDLKTPRYLRRRTKPKEPVLQYFAGEIATK